MLDTFRRDRVSCYGYERETTPNLDDFAGQATVYEDAVAQSNTSIPSHAAVFTGKYPSQHGATRLSPILREQPTIAGRLRRAGYRTVGVSSNYYIRPLTGFGQGFDQFHTPGPFQEPEIPRSLRFSVNTLLKAQQFHLPLQQLYNQFCQHQHAPRAMMEPAEGSWTLEETAPVMQETREPFFLFANFVDAHLPRSPLPRFRDRFVDDELRGVRVPTNTRAHLFDGGEMDRRQRRKLSQLYDADLRTVDHWFGRFMDRLRAAGRFDDSLIIVVSDHGEHLGEFGLIGHQYSMFDAVTSVPLLIRYPGQEQGRRVPHQVEARQVFDTVMDVTGVADGEESLRTVDRGRAAYSEYYAQMLDAAALVEEREAVVDPGVFGETVSFLREPDVKHVDFHGRQRLYPVPDHGPRQLPIAAWADRESMRPRARTR